MRSAVVFWGKSGWLKGGWDIAEEGEIAGDADSLKKVGKAEESDVKGMGGDGRGLEDGGGFVAVDE